MKHCMRIEEPPTSSLPTAADLRARRARLKVMTYDLAPLVRCHPARLGSYLAGSLPMPADIAARLDRALRQLEYEAKRRGAGA